MLKSIPRVFVAVVLLCSGSVAIAKRSEPAPVGAVVRDGIEFRAPRDHMGCVEAFDVKTGEQLWWKQIYVVKFDPILERDVQEVFITALKPAEGSLLITNEAGGEFALDLKSLEVKAIRGAIVLHPERR